MARFDFGGYRRAIGRAPLRALKLSRLALAVERAAQAFWPLLTLLCFIAAAALFGAFAALDAATHRIAVLGALALVVLALAWGVLRFRMPDRRAAADRLDAADPARPLATLSDSLAAGREDGLSRSLWHEHLRRAELAAGRLRPRLPDPRLERRDHWALRLFAPTVLIAGLIGAGGDWAGRLATLFEPPPDAAAPGAAAAARTPLVEAWATPPGYTGLPTVYLNRLAEAGQDIVLPQGAELVVRVSDPPGAPELSAPGVTGLAGFADYGGELSEARGVVDATGPVEVRAAGAALAAWQVTVIPDKPPEVWLTGRPGTTLAGALEVQYGARDDYGVVSAWAEIVPLGGFKPGKGLDLPELTFGLPLPINSRALEVEDSTVRDFGEHPWAGGWVELRLHAEDGAGQRATVGPVKLKLPGRFFTHPLARALVEQRRELALDFGRALRVLDVLQAVTRVPEQVFATPSGHINGGAYLGTRTAIRRLAGGIVGQQVPEVAPDVTEFLWLAALSLEDGDLSSALERLRAAEEALRRALESGSEEDIRKAMENLRAAMQQYLDEMVRQALERGLQPGQQGPAGQSQTLSRQDLEEMLDQMQRQAESGLRDQARDMLSQLSRMLENLQAGRPQQGAGQSQMQALQQLIQRQRDLADRTFGEQRRQQREGRSGQGREGLPQPGDGQPGQGRGDQAQPGQTQPGGDGFGGQEQGAPGEGQRGAGREPGNSGALGGLSAEQEALRRALAELAGRLPGGAGDGARQALDEAGRSMGGARDDLDANDPGGAVEDQMDALEKLAEGAQSLAEAIRNGQGQTAGRGRGRSEGRAQDLQADPFDRPAGSYGAIDGTDTKVPDRSALDRAREVLDELRRRAAEPQRPQLELDYLDRLLEQF